MIGRAFSQTERRKDSKRDRSKSSRGGSVERDKEISPWSRDSNTNFYDFTPRNDASAKSGRYRKAI